MIYKIENWLFVRLLYPPLNYQFTFHNSPFTIHHSHLTRKFSKKSGRFSYLRKKSRMNTFRANDERILTKYQKSFNDNITLVSVSKKGLLPQAVFDFISLSDFPFPYVEKVLNKTIKTFTSYKKNKTPLDPVLSEKLLKFFALYDKGQNVFGSVDEFNKWLAEPAFGLGNIVPKDLLETITGIELVSQELTRIEYGDLA